MQMETVIFFRGDCFYLAELMDPAECGKSLADQAKEHAELNPGTLKVISMADEVLWQAKIN